MTLLGNLRIIISQQRCGMHSDLHMLALCYKIALITYAFFFIYDRSKTSITKHLKTMLAIIHDLKGIGNIRTEEQHFRHLPHFTQILGYYKAYYDT